MARPRPRDPEALAAVVAALRAAANDQQGDEFGRTSVGELKAAGVEKATAARLAARFDRLSPSLRENALGEFANRPIQRGSRALPGGGTGGGASGGNGGGTARRGPRTRGDVLRGSDPGAGGTTTAAGSAAASVLDGSRAPEPGMVSDGGGASAPTYSINYQGFQCEAETNWDFFTNSDEVYAITSTVTIAADGSNTVRTEKVPTDRPAYEDVDAGETRIGPVARSWEGALLPVSLSVVAFEQDQGDPNAYRDEIDAIVKASILAAKFLLGLGAPAAAILEAFSGTITDAINWLVDTADDQIDITRTLVFEQQTLEELGKRAPAPYSYVEGTQVHQTNLWGHFFSTHSGDGAKYTFAFKLERNPAFVEEVIIV